MKNSIILILACTLPLLSQAQIHSDLQFVAPFSEDVAAIQKNDKWGFVDRSGTLVIDYRDDFVIPKGTHKEKPYPYFQQGRAIITHVKDNIVRYGFVNKKGETVIDTEYLKVQPFSSYGKAVALKLHKQNLGENDMLQKTMIRYVYTEVIIDSMGNIIYTLPGGPKHILPYKDKMKTSPNFISQIVSSQLIVLKNADATYTLIDVSTKNN